MTWPQIVAAIWFAIVLALGVRDDAKDRSISSGHATFRFFVRLVHIAVTALVLHAGGFW